MPEYTDREKELLRDLAYAAKLIRALLGAPPPRVWRKSPNVYQKATEFLHWQTVLVADEFVRKGGERRPTPVAADAPSGRR